MGQRFARASFECMTIALLVMASAGCGESRKGRLVFSVGGAPRELEVWEDLVSQFEQRSGLEVELVRQPSDTAQQRQSLVLALDSGQVNPDVFLMDVAWLGLFAEAGWLAPLAGIDRSAFIPEIVERTDVRDGRLVALPVYVDAGLLYYRKDLLDGPPPSTWDELRRTAAAVQARERPNDPAFYGFVWQGAQYEGLVCTFLEFAGSGGGLVRTDGRLLVDLPANESALERMRDMIRKDRISPPSTYTEMREEQVCR